MGIGDSGRVPTALVLDDEAASRFAIRAILERGGFDVLECAHAPGAIEICERNPGLVTILVTDVVLRGQTGPEAIRQMIAVQPGMAILFVSGYPLDQALNRGIMTLDLSGTPMDFLQKPFTVQTLLGIVRRLIEKSRT